MRGREKAAAGEGEGRGGEVVEDHRESLWKTRVANASLEPLELESIFLCQLFKESGGGGRGERRGARSHTHSLSSLDAKVESQRRTPL